MIFLNWTMLGSLALPVAFSWVVSLLVMLYSLRHTNLQEKAIFTVLMGTVVLGYYMRLVNLGGVFSAILIALLLYYLIWMISQKKVTIQWKDLLIQLTVLIFVFVAWYWMGPKTSSCEIKLHRIIGTILWGALQFIFLLGLPDIKMSKLAPLFTSATVFLTFSILLLHYHVSTTYPDILRIYFYYDKANAFNYQILIIYSCLAVVMTMESKDESFMWKFSLILSNIWIAVISGGRQVLIGCLLCFICVILLNSLHNRRLLLFYACSISVVLVVVSLFITYTGFDEESVWFSTTHAENLSQVLNRDENTFTYMRSIMEHSLWLGAGLGGYVDANLEHDYGETYPHNFFLEVFYEMGFLGLLILILPFLFFCCKYSIKSFLLMKSRSSFYVLPFFLIYFTRSMVSDGLNFSVNIVVFILVMLATYQKTSVMQADNNVPELK